MLQELAQHEQTKFHFLFIGDESRRFHASDHRMMWVASWEDPNEIERPSYFRKKTVFTTFFNRTGDFKIVILPKVQKMNRRFFLECMLGLLA
jgi:hypothetical protein